MSLLTSYRRNAPFTIDKLLEAANAVLASGGAVPILKRTLRFYTSQKVVPKPLGSPKFARYGYEHLLIMLAARALQDQGMKLHQIAHEVEEVKRGNFARIEKMVEEWIANRPAGLVRETVETYAVDVEDLTARSVSIGTLVRQFPLTANASLTVSGNVLVKNELEAAREAIDGLIKQLK
jgi:DNA-binding transcriptional MerR regulator